MSFILDALQKSQSEQAVDGVRLRLQEDRPKRSLTPWLSLALIIVLLSNVGLLVWVFVLDKPPTTPPAEQVIPTTSKIAKRPADRGAIVPPPVQVQAQSGEPSPIARETQPLLLQPVSQPQPSRERVMLAELPVNEQTLYNSLTYSTHIFTDDPALCAIVVDGQRLMAGDSFKGLSVVAITEAGVIFEERRRGQRRQVEVSVLDQWENQAP